ncbi:S8 family serine peptidase [candidate division WOR-3 bacterium]|nr:S8 family serine peptidase [candidate division WOR-3 bacterium]
MNHIRPLLLCLAIFSFTNVKGRDANKELWVRFRSGLVALPAGFDSCSIENLNAPVRIKAILNQINPAYVAQSIELMRFNPADTIEITGDGRVLRFPDLSSVFLIGFSSEAERDSVKMLLDTLLVTGDVITIAKNCYGQYREYIPNDQYFYKQWNMHNTGEPWIPEDTTWIAGEDINATKAWEYSMGNPTMRLAIIDSGVEDENVDLEEKVDFPGDGLGHGSQVAGIAAASHNNYGIVGVAPRCLLRNHSLGFTTNFEEVIDAIYYNADAGYPIMNLSLGFSEYNADLEEACTYAFNKGSLIVAAQEQRYCEGPSLGDFRNSVLSVTGLTASGIPAYYHRAGGIHG